MFPQTACFAFANKTLALAVGRRAERPASKDGYYDKLLDQYGVLKTDPPFAISGPGPA